MKHQIATLHEPAAIPRSRCLPFIFWLTALVVLPWAAGSCEVDVDTGKEGFPCNPDGTCDEGLVCIDGVCERDPCDAVSCEAEEVCLQGACYARHCETRVCPEDMVCLDEVCVASSCAGVSCETGHVCADGRCYPTDCGTVDCGEEEVCVDGGCVPRSCVGIVCGAGEACANGRCYSTDCAGIDCGAGVCVDGACMPPSCVGVECPDTHACGDGACYPVACPVDCAPGEVCYDDACVEAACVGVACPDGQACGRGLCWERSCLDEECVEGEVCDDGRCVPASCAGVVCPEGEACAAGKCREADCSTRRCGLREVCADEKCVLDLCYGRVCPEGERCAAGGACVPIDCPFVQCGDDEVCDVDGETCVTPSCYGVTCGEGEHCVRGDCAPMGCEQIDCSHLDGPCVEGVCDEETASCVAVPLPAGTPCGSDGECDGEGECSEGCTSFPNAPDTTGGERCGPGSVILLATQPAGSDTNRWYATPSDGALLHQGASFSTPSISSTTTYYVSSYHSTTGCESLSRTPVTATILDVPAAPDEGSHIVSNDEITWVWSPVSGAAGYRWGTTADLDGAVDKGEATTRTQDGLDVGTTYNVFVWAYDASCVSAPREMSAATTTPPCHGYEMGDAYGGGIIAWKGHSAYLDSDYCLIVATEDESSGNQWGCAMETSIAGTSTAIGAGPTNTAAIVDGCLDADCAARVCNDSTREGFGDWFLPSEGELLHIYTYECELFEPDHFETTWYWTSSQFSGEWEAWAVVFGCDGDDVPSDCDEPGPGWPSFIDCTVPCNTLCCCSYHSALKLATYGVRCVRAEY